MTRRAMWIGLLCCLLAAGSGCRVCNAVVCEPSYGGDCGGCGSCGDCGDVCETSRGPVCPPYCGPHEGPLTWFFSLFHCGTYRCNGCGDTYWGDWWDNPPDCCERCDRQGHYRGGSQRYYGARGGEFEYEEGPMPTRNSGCSDCNGGQASRNSAPHTRAVSRSSAPYAPRMVSQSDRVVRPAAPRPQYAPAREPGNMAQRPRGTTERY